jgi:hypothetical protein
VYLLADELPAANVNLRLSKARNGQVKRTRDAAEYRDPWRMFGVGQRGQVRTSGLVEPGLEGALCEVPGRALGTAKVADDTAA